MSLQNLLHENRSKIINEWRELIIKSYPTDTQRFLKKEKNRFSNPVGQTIAQDVEILYDTLITNKDVARISSSLDNIIRIRAVQDFKPSKAVGFVLQLKMLIRKQVANENLDVGALHNEVEALEQRIEDAALLAFDIYMQCCRKIYELRVNETKRHVANLLKRANLTIDIPGLEPGQ